MEAVSPKCAGKDSISERDRYQADADRCLIEDDYLWVDPLVEEKLFDRLKYSEFVLNGHVYDLKTTKSRDQPLQVTN